MDEFLEEHEVKAFLVEKLSVRLVFASICGAFHVVVEAFYVIWADEFFGLYFWPWRLLRRFVIEVISVFIFLFFYLRGLVVAFSLHLADWIIMVVVLEFFNVELAIVDSAGFFWLGLL